MFTPLPWERPIWRMRRRWPNPVEYVLTDFRIVRMSPDAVEELALEDLAEVRQVRSKTDRWPGWSTLECHACDPRRAPLVLSGVRRGTAVAALIDLVATSPRDRLAQRDVRAILGWTPRLGPRRVAEWSIGVLAAVVAVFGVAITLDGESPSATYASNDPIRPAGVKRSRTAIVAFMEADVMPWARRALGPIVGGAASVTCETCHGQDAEARDWRMPAVGRLPEPHVRQLGWERSGGVMDAQMRNAIYGYLAGSDNQSRAGYMREVVLPGMARLLERPPYDFTRSYEENRQRLAFGCYHCHQVG